MRKKFDCTEATIWSPIDLECELLSKKEKVLIKKYSKGRIKKDISNRYVIAEFEDKKEVKLDKKYIVINLADVMQKEVVYSISNATSALYNIHGNEIPGVTGKTLYPSTSIDNEVKAVLMFRTAEKLFKAEELFLEKGLTIKIYDTYRPYEVTKYLYENTLKVSDKYKEFLNGTVNGFEYSQKWFLAEKASSHNYGVAIDMTLVDLKSNEELKMQTRMHDLSIYSVVDYNNKEADRLSRVMKKCGFTTLRSEWWHFQDNKSKVDVMNLFMDKMVTVH